MRPAVSVEACARASWDAFRRAPLPIVGATVVYFAAQLAGSLLPWVSLAFTFFCGIHLAAGYTWFLLNVARGHEPLIADLWAGFSTYGRLVGAAALFVGLVFLVLAPLSLGPALFDPSRGADLAGDLLGRRGEGAAGPDLFFGALTMLLAVGLGVRWMFVLPALMDDPAIGPVEALRRSMALTRGRWPRLLGVLVASAALAILGLFAFLVGGLVTVPLSYLMITNAYLQALAEEEEEAWDWNEGGGS